MRCDRGGNSPMDTHHLPMRSASNIQILSLILREIEDLLLLDKPPIQPSGTGSLKKRGNVVSTPNTSEPYNRQKYNQYAADRTKGFTELYAFCFALAKPPYVTAPLGLFVSQLTLIWMQDSEEHRYGCTRLHISSHCADSDINLITLP